MLAIAPILHAEKTESFFPVSDRGDDTTISGFEEGWYSKHLRLMGESSLYAKRGDKELEVYRFTLLPTWGNPRCAVIAKDKQGSQTIFRFYRLDGHGGYNPGKLVEQEERALTENEFARFISLFEKIEFLKQTTKDPIRGRDGSKWILESLKEGQYHIVVRWTANAYDPKERGTETFVDLCNWMLENAPRDEKAEQGGAGQRR